METVELKFQYTQSEYLRAEQQYLIANKTIHKNDIVVLAVFLLISVAFMLLSSFNICSILIFWLAIIVTALKSYLYILIPMVKFKQTAKYHEEYTLIFSKETIRFKTPSIQSEMRWNIYCALWDNHDFYYLIQTRRIHTVIPKRVFKDQNEKQAFEEIVQSNVERTMCI